MDLHIDQINSGNLLLTAEVPNHRSPLILPGAQAYYFQGQSIEGLFQNWAGDGFAIWYSNYWTGSRPATLRATSNGPTLELRISLRDEINGTWDDFFKPTVTPLHYQVSYAPFINTLSHFSPSADYRTFDIHYDQAYLERKAQGNPAFERFLNKVIQQQPAQLIPEARPCPTVMLENVRAIINNTYTPRGRDVLLEASTALIINAALEDNLPAPIVQANVSMSQLDAALAAEKLIREGLPIYPSNKRLQQVTAMGIQTLQKVFKAVYGKSTFEFYNECRMEVAKAYLLAGEPVNMVAARVNYEDTAFIKRFKQFSGMTPKVFQSGKKNHSK